jgi:hypothetical protein
MFLNRGGLKMTIDRSVKLLAPLVAYCCTSTALAVCAVNDANFTTADGGCKDLTTGLVWSSDVLGLAGVGSPTSSNGSPTVCNYYFGATPEAGGFTDWRPPSVGEVQAALANGLASHLDFYYAAGNQPDDGKHRYTSCNAPKIRGATPKYVIRYSDGSIISSGFDSYQSICVRGRADDGDCPGPGKKKNRSSSAGALSQTSTGALLLLPLVVVIGARCVRSRRL